MKVLVTGATGFVGSHLCDSLRAQGHEVFALIRSPKKARSLPKTVNQVQGDLKIESIEKWIKTLPDDLDCVIHTAGIVHSFSKEDFHKINTLATIHLIELFKKYYKELHFVFVSSLAAVGPNPPHQPHVETDELFPTSAYGHSKKAAEEALETLAPSEWKTSIIRPPMVIGPRDTAILDVFKMVASGVVLSTGLNGMKKLYSFVCVHDLVSVVIATLTEQSLKNDVFFTAHPEQVLFHEIIDEISSQMNKKTITLYIPNFLIFLIAYILKMINHFKSLEVRLTPDKLHELTPMAWQCSGASSEETLKVNYKWNFKDTIKLTYTDYQKRGWL